MNIKVKELIKKYDELIAVNNMSFEVKKGEFITLLGPNGSGKTTLMNCILSILKYNNGSIMIDDETMTPNNYRVKHKIGVVPQDICVLSDLTVYENVDYFCGLYISDKKKRQEYVKEAIEFVKLESHQKVIAKKLSGGLKRRLNIACGIAHKPELIFFDEPTAQVDAQSRNFILEGIKKLNEKGTTVVYTTHYIDEIEYITDRILVMDKGKCIADGSLNNLINLSSISETIFIELLVENDVTDLFRSLDHMYSVTRDHNIYTLKFTSQGNIEKILYLLKEHQIEYINFHMQRPTLNDVFLELTGKELRE